MQTVLIAVGDKSPEPEFQQIKQRGEAGRPGVLGCVLSTWLGSLPPGLSCLTALGNKWRTCKAFLDARAEKQPPLGAKKCAYGPSLSIGLAWAWETLLYQTKFLEIAKRFPAQLSPPDFHRLELA